MTGRLGKGNPLARSHPDPGTLPTLRRLLLAAAMLVPSGACSVYDHEYEFEPRPLDVTTWRPGEDSTKPVHTLVSVVGVRRADDKTGLPASVEIRLRVENTSPLPVVFDPGTLMLHTAGLEPLADPIVSRREPLSLTPGEDVLVEAFFPFPAGSGPRDFDLSGLNVRWVLSIDGRPVTSSAAFRRLPTGYYDRYPDRIGVGYQGYR